MEAMGFIVPPSRFVINIDYGQRMAMERTPAPVHWLTTAEVARRLGVKPATIYAYVSRGVLTRHRDPADRTSRFPAHEVEALALRGRPREASLQRALEFQMETRITEIDGHTIRFRGHDVTTLARTHTFEQVAELLWSGELPASATWPVVRVAMHGEPDRMGEWLQLVAAHVAVGPVGRRHRESVPDEGRRIISALVDSLPVVGDGRSPRLVLADDSVVRGSLAGRLWAGLAPRRPTPALVATMNAALVLLADHEMAASTLAARVAASTRAGPHAVVAAGMGALSGPLHGGESRRCRHVLRTAAGLSASSAIGAALQFHGRVPGFGQVLYPQGDPRAVLLLQMLREAGPHPMIDVADRLIEAAARRRLPPPNVDLALALFGAVTDMREDGAEAVFTSARVAGWLAHAMEEYEERPLRFRPRATYVGVRSVDRG
jgi:citrate synthase